MSESNVPERWLNWQKVILVLACLLAGLLVVLAGAMAVLITGLSPLGLIMELPNTIWAVNSPQAMWYVTRAAGIVGYLLLWLSTVWGLAVASKILDPVLSRAFTYDFHEFLSLLSIGFIILHVAVLLADRYLPFTLVEVLVPFMAPYRPLWVGIGGIAFYLTLLVTVTFYLRSWIGSRAFRAIHLASFLAYAGGAVHGLAAGTDSVLPAAQLMYAGTTLVVVFLTVYWLWIARSPRPERPGVGVKAS